MSNIRKVSIGLDIGISSIGFCVIDVDSKEILKRQSHLFRNISEDGKKERGIFRRSRRTLRRRRVRKDDFIKLVDTKYSNIFKFDIIKVLKSNIYNVYELAYKGLTQELKPDELFRVLYHRLSFRGVSHKPVSEKFDKYLSEEFYEIYNKYGKIRHHNIRSFDEIIINNKDKETKIDKFSIFKNEIDLRKIMSNCSYLEKNNFVNDYLSIFTRNRDSSKGPGGEKSPSNYGVYRLVDNKVQKVLETIWEENIGFCSIFNKKNDNPKRNSKNLLRSYSGEVLPELSLALSQLNSIKIMNDNNEIEKLNEKDKKKIILESLNQNKNISITIIKKVLEVEKDKIFGYPTTSDNQPNFQSFKRLNYYLKNGVIKLEKYKTGDGIDWNSFIEDLSLIDNLFSKSLILYFVNDEQSFNNKDYNESIKKIKELDNDNIIQNYEAFCDMREVTPNINYSFSSKAFKEYFNENFDTNEIISVFYKKDIDSTNKNSFYYGNGKYLKPEGIDKISFLNKYVFVVFRELVKIMNDFLKDYVYNGNCIIESIVIESTTNKKNNLLAEKENKKINLLNNHLSKIYGNSDNLSSEFDNWFKENKFSNDLDTPKNRQRYYLWKEQGGKDFYNLNSNGELKTINENEIFDCEIDHIIPKHYECLNEFPQNYILTKSRINNDKSDTLPFNYLGSKFENYLKLWEQIFNLNEKKEKRFWLVQKLKYLKANNIDELGLKFLKKHLTLTSYSIKIIKTYLQNWIENKIESNINDFDKFKDAKIYTINGFVTQGLRNQIAEKLKWNTKDRDNAEEHSIDAFICSILGSDFKLKNLLEKISNFEFFKLKQCSEIQNFKKINFKRYDLSEYINSFSINENWIYTIKNTNKLTNCNLEEKMDRLFNSNKYFNKGKFIQNNSFDSYDKRNGKECIKKRINLLEKLSKKEEISNWNNSLINLFEVFEKEKNKSNKYYFYNDFKVISELNKILKNVLKNEKYNKNQNPFSFYMDEMIEIEQKNNDYNKNRKYEFQKTKELGQVLVKIRDSQNKEINVNIRRITYLDNESPSIGIDLSNKNTKNKYFVYKYSKCDIDVSIDKIQIEKPAKTSYLEGLSKKAILIVKYDLDKEKPKFKFIDLNVSSKIYINKNELNIDNFNTFKTNKLFRIDKDDSIYELIDILEIGSIFLIDNNLWRLTSYDKNTNRIYLNNCENSKKDLKRVPYSNLLELLNNNNITIKNSIYNKISKK